MKILKSKKKFIIMDGYTEVTSFRLFEDAQEYLNSKGLAEERPKYKKGARAGGVKQFQSPKHSVMLDLDSDFEYVEGKYLSNKHGVD